MKGGARPGAGRKKGSTLPVGKLRINYSGKMSNLEMDLIKRAAKLQNKRYTTFIRNAALEKAVIIIVLANRETEE